ncbi:class I SAM-dependent methyltransferase [Terrarubrum flagellatum]|uniref:class I SAM-dependent methyltransferase n=1 Tax=Terrirubrum flagellatum TaxID=2895980 RepID=UPI0031450773
MEQREQPPIKRHAALMDRTYRFQRHIYDATRKHYLLGRSLLIERLQPPHEGTALEVGAGTASNLILAAELYPTARLYGVDISSMMLATARTKIEHRGLSDRIRLQLADATRLDGLSFFNVGQFDRIFFSYSLSMIPDWRAALDCALTHLKPGGELHIVDFGDMSELPRIAKSGLRMWLRWFHVTPRDELRGAIASMALGDDHSCAFESLWSGYAFHAVIKKRASH